MKEKLLIVAAILFLIAIIHFVIDYFMFHYLGKDGKLHKERHELPEKPFVTNLMGMVGTTLLGASIITLVIALVCF